MISQLKTLAFGGNGVAAKTKYFNTLPELHEQLAERFIAFAQLVLVSLLLATESFDQAQYFGTASNNMILIWLIIFVASVVLRLIVSYRKKLPDTTLDALTVIDVVAFSSIVVALQVSTVNKTILDEFDQITLWLAVLVVIRTMRINPRTILVSGGTALIWLLVSPEILLLDNGPATTASFRFDLGAYSALSLLVGLLTLATWQARKTLGYLNTTLEGMPHGVALFDDKNCLLVSNSQYSQLYGLSDDHRKRGTSISDLIRYRHQAGCFGEVDYHTHSTEWMESFIASEPSTQQLHDGRVFSILRQKDQEGRIVTTTEDVTTQRYLEERVRFLAYHDSLTGLANRTQLRERLEKILIGNRNNDEVAVFCMDLDKFKEVNDTLGHEIGDDLLSAVGQRLMDCVREEDLVARTGGDEFIILQMGECISKHSAGLAQRIIDRLTEPFDLRGHQVMIGVSIGIAFPNPQELCVDRLIENADTALYRAKEVGRGIYCFYDESMSLRLQERREIETGLRKALERQEFELYYQPIKSANSGLIESMEALVRWRHPDKGITLPSEFIPIIDEIGLAVPLGDWVIWQACKDTVTLSENIRVSVNVSAAQFHKPGLAYTVAEVLHTTGLPAKQLELEITETVLLETSPTTIATLRRLHELGVRIALDDFGIGYSSLSYLTKFSFDRLKIDRSFVQDTLNDGSASEIIKSVIELGQRLGMEVTAEGVETAEQFNQVVADGCDAIQGFMISRPLTLTEMNKFLKAELRRNVDDLPHQMEGQVG